MSLHPPAKRLRSATDSLVRLAESGVEVARSANQTAVNRRLRDVTKPPSLSGGMKKAGVALILAPDPLTGIPGIALLASSFAIRSREPASLGSLAQQTRRVLRDIQSLTL